MARTAPVFLAAALLSGTLNGAERPSRFDRKLLESHVEFLASDELEGRGNGTTGLELAASYIAGQFEALGLSAVGDENTYFQRFQVSIGHHLAKPPRAVLRVSGQTRELAPGEDFEPLTFSAPGDVSAAVVFAGYGVSAPEHDYDDYAAIDVRGKVVLVLRYAPGGFDERGWHATFVRKTRVAASHGALGAIIVNGPRHRRDDELVPFGVDVGAERMPIPVIHLRREHAEWALQANGSDLRGLQKRIDASRAPASSTLESVEISLSIDIEQTSAEVENVLGYLPPSGGRPSGFDEECIVIGAHYDHVGFGEKGSRDYRARGKVHNGADDNASGVAGVIELARLFSKIEDRPRGIVFAAFAGEEIGLRGSSHYTSHPVLSLSSTVAMVNLDMIGRLRHGRLFLAGLDLVPELSDLVQSSLDEEGLVISRRFSGADASDHAPFVRAGVPSLFFFTGLHGDYHKPTDDPQFISYEGMERVLEVSYQLVDYLLHVPSRPARPMPTATDDDGPTPYFGVGVDTNFAGDGVRFAYVASGGPASEAGLLPGDVLVEIDGRPVKSSERASVILQQFRPGDRVSAKVRRDEQVLEVVVKVAKWP